MPCYDLFSTESPYPDLQWIYPYELYFVYILRLVNTTFMFHESQRHHNGQDIAGMSIVTSQGVIMLLCVHIMTSCAS